MAPSEGSGLTRSWRREFLHRNRDHPLRGADQDDRAPLASQLSQGREQQPPFALARLRLQDFGQALYGPAPARQVRV